jgi:hypothetical protein
MAIRTVRPTFSCMSGIPFPCISRPVERRCRIELRRKVERGLPMQEASPPPKFTPQFGLTATSAWRYGDCPQRPHRSAPMARKAAGREDNVACRGTTKGPPGERSRDLRRLALFSGDEKCMGDACGKANDVPVVHRLQQQMMPTFANPGGLLTSATSGCGSCHGAIRRSPQ